LIPAAKSLPDTDWHIPQLYDFAAELGASTLAAEYSRFVIDLNRPSDDKPLYAGATTGLYPATLFDGVPLFREGLEPSKKKRATYLEQIWTPYHRTLQQELARLKAEFGYALLFDAHSIRSVIPHLFDGKLPDFNLGTFNGASCDPACDSAGSDLRRTPGLQPCAERTLQGRPHHPALRQPGRKHPCRATGAVPVHVYGRV
jgi:formiminoglutamase